MASLGWQICGLFLYLMGILGVVLTCGIPMWRQTSFVGPNVVTAQSVWDGLWLHCVVQATGQIQCKRHTSPSLTVDLQAGRALSLISIICGFLGFMVVLLGGGVVNCYGVDPEDQYWSSRSSRKKACIMGGALCALSGVLCLVSVSWSAAITTSINNDQRVGSSIYIGLVSSLLLLLSAGLIGFVCWEKTTQPLPSNYSNLIYSDNSGTITIDRTSRYEFPLNTPKSVHSNLQRGQGYTLRYPDPFWAPFAL